MPLTRVREAAMTGRFPYHYVTLLRMPWRDSAYRQLLQSTDRQTAADALFILIADGDRWGTRWVLRYGRDSWMRAQAAKGLLELDGIHSASRLRHALYDAQPEVRHTAAECLARLTNPEPGDDDTQHNAAKHSLRRSWTRWQLRRALRQAVHSSDPLVRYWAVTGLGRLPGSGQQLQHLQDDDNVLVQETAWQTLRRLRPSTPA